MSFASSPLSRRHTRPRRLTVLDAETPRATAGARLRRIRFGGPDLHDFPDMGPGAHIKLFVPEPGAEAVLPVMSAQGPQWPEGPRPAARTYSVRSLDAANGTLDVEFVLHGGNGPASRWAAEARVGDSLGLAGPGGPPLLRRDAEFFLLAGDLSALPAIAAVLEQLPPTASGVALIEADPPLPLVHPPALQLHWLGSGQTSPLPEAVRALQWPTDSRPVSATVAGESDAVMAIRRYLRRDRQLPRDALYAVPYWRRGHSEEQYHEQRHELMDQDS
jgi:NADPH-dependent ferric siderophore reductase